MTRSASHEAQVWLATHKATTIQSRTDLGHPSFCVHQPIVSDKDYQVGSPACMDRGIFRITRDDRLYLPSGSIIEKVDDGLFDFSAAISIGDQIDCCVLVLEDTSLQHGGRWVLCFLDEFPVGTLREKSSDTVSGAPVEIPLKVFAISKAGWYRNDTLMLIVAKRDQHVNNPGWVRRSRLDRLQRRRARVFV